MGPHSVREYAASLRGRYRLASRREKTRLLDEFCRVTTPSLDALWKLADR